MSLSLSRRRGKKGIQRRKSTGLSPRFARFEGEEGFLQQLQSLGGKKKKKGEFPDAPRRERRMGKKKGGGQDLNDDDRWVRPLKEKKKVFFPNPLPPEKIGERRSGLEKKRDHPIFLFR